MTHWTSLAPTVLAAFAASLVEFVEALTIILAVGIVRGWRSPLLGAGSALALLVALVGLFGKALTGIPLPVVQIVVGTLLLLFGLRWLRKAVLRGAGVLALHDEEQAFRDETAALRAAPSAPRNGIDAVAFATAFKTVLLEGIEVVFIVVAIGAGGALIVPASVGAAAALFVVIVLGLLLHRPLAALPENKLKFGVGVLLSAFGLFWVGEGMGLSWPGGDWAILWLAATVCAVGLVLVPACARLSRAGQMGKPGAPSGVAKPVGRVNAALIQAWKLFVDDGWLAVGILAWVALAIAVRASAAVELSAERTVFAGGLMVMLAVSALRRAAQAAKRASTAGSR